MLSEELAERDVEHHGKLRIVGRSVLLSPPEKLNRVSGAAAAC